MRIGKKVSCQYDNKSVTHHKNITKWEGLWTAGDLGFNSFDEPGDLDPAISPLSLPGFDSVLGRTEHLGE